MVMKKINVVGTTGSGKSTFSRALADALGYRYVQLDELFWKPDWQEAGDDEFFGKIQHALNSDHWVLDGNYSRTQSIKWEQADTIIWLDYSYTRTPLQLLKRTVTRATTRQELWQGTGNRESFYKSFFSRDSILLWFFKAYPTIRERYSALQTDPSIKHINFIRLRNPAEASQLLQKVNTKPEHTAP